MSTTEILLNDASHPKAEMWAVVAYLHGINVKVVVTTESIGSYASWHGDGKSKTSAGSITFQTMSMTTSESPKRYRTIVSRKGQPTAWYARHTSSTWDGPESIIADILGKLKEKGYDKEDS